MHPSNPDFDNDLPLLLGKNTTAVDAHGEHTSHFPSSISSLSHVSSLFASVPSSSLPIDRNSTCSGVTLAHRRQLSLDATSVHDLDDGQLILVPGLDRIFDVSSSGSASPLGTTPTFTKEDAFSFVAEGKPQLVIADGGCLKMCNMPANVDVVEVDDLQSTASMWTILDAEGRRDRSEWLVVYVRGTTTAILFPPKRGGGGGVSGMGRSVLIACMEWLEEVGLSQVFVAVGNDEEALLKRLLFLGFSRVPREVLAAQLPYLSKSSMLLVTDFAEL
ncbi:unnamed protein product [Mesocestoides corti]|uniref:Ornithine decarboxylase antizyme n=1 Tax=Mesocestoides corti TaxID=53468 RepID=A0A0R3U2T1_MESCO|nr:unnamed protein product [Mesocestoides corti]